MNSVLRRVNKKTTVGFAAFLISTSYMASRVLGLLRDRLLAAHFGIGPLADAYAAAFRLPDLLFSLLVSGAFAVAFIPVLTEHWVKGEEQEAWEVSSVLLNILMLSTLVLAVVFFIFADPLTKLITPGFDPYRHHITVNLTRIMLATPFFFAISSVFGSIQQSFNRFFFYAVASIFYNFGIIFGIVFLTQHYSIYGVAIGVVVGTIIQALVQMLGLIGLGYRYRFSFKLRHKSVRKVIKLMIPRTIDQGIDQINYLVQTVIGSTLPIGSLTAYYYANNLKNVPLNIFGTAIAVAAFPQLAAEAASENKQKLIESFVINLRLIIFLVLPAATVSVLLRGYIVRLLFGFGNATTANLLGWFAGVIIFQSIFLLICRVYYALQDSKTPLYSSILCIALNIILSIVLTRRYGAVGLPMAQSIAVAAEAIILLVILKFRLHSIGEWQIFAGVIRMILANFVMAGVLYVMAVQVFPLYLADHGFRTIAPKFVLICLAGLVAYIAPSYVLGLREAKQFIGKIREHALRPLNLN
jgi:putative peptidoglycan lipid II flippase